MAQKKLQMPDKDNNHQEKRKVETVRTKTSPIKRKTQASLTNEYASASRRGRIKSLAKHMKKK